MFKNIIIYIFLTGCVVHGSPDIESPVKGGNVDRQPEVGDEVIGREPSASCRRIIYNFILDTERAGGAVGGTISEGALMYFAKFKTSFDLLIISPLGAQKTVDWKQSSQKSSCTKGKTTFESIRVFGIAI
jgi:hypothetical protein